MSKTSGGFVNRSAVFSMTLCVAMLIASEFVPLSLLTPIAHGLHVTPAQTGEALSISGLFAMLSALMTTTLIGKVNRKYVLLGMTAFMLVSLITTAIAPNFIVLMISRACLGICVGGFWSLSASIIMRLVPESEVSKAFGIMYMGQSLAAAFAAPLGSFLEVFIGWRGVFLILVPIVLLNLIWQFVSLPSLPSNKKTSVDTLISLLKRPYFARGMVCMALTFGGAFTMFTYLRPYLEQKLELSVNMVTLCFLVLGLMGFAGGSFGSKMTQRNVLSLLKLVPVSMAVITVALIFCKNLTIVFVLLGVWGLMNTALSVGWMGWMSQNVKDQPEAAGSLMAAIIQGSILIGSTIGGQALSITNIDGTFMCSVVISALAFILIGKGKKLLNHNNG